MIDNLLEVIKSEVDTFMRLKMRDTREQYVHLVPVIDQAKQMYDLILVILTKLPVMISML